jgi:hypothetical protein
MKKEELLSEKIFCVFDGRFFGVATATNPKKATEVMGITNIDLALMSEGYNVTRADIKSMFNRSVIRNYPLITWYLLDQTEGELLIDIISGEILLSDLFNPDSE